MKNFGVVLATVALSCAFVSASHAQDAVAAPSNNSVVIDDFENGVANWTRNDKAHADNPAAIVSLVDVVATSPGSGAPRELSASRGAALFSFKSAKGAWASASARVNGAQWAKIGAQRITFWINADGATQDTNLVLRASLPGANGARREEVWTIPVRLREKRWRKVVIPLGKVERESGKPLLSRLGNIYLVQFVQSGTWESRFFTVDQFQVEGSGTALTVATAAATPRATPATPTQVLPADATRVNVDFLRTQGRITTAANVSLGAAASIASGTVTYPLTASSAFRNALTVLRPRIVRVDAAALVEMTDSSRPSFDFARLVASARQVRALGAEPMIALVNDPAWGLNADGFAQFSSQAVRALSAAKVAVPRWEVIGSTTALSDAETVAAYNKARAAIKKVAPQARVGGVASLGSRPSLLNALLRGAQGLDFLSVQFYGATAGKPDAANLFATTRSLSSLRMAATALDRTRFRMAPIYVTGSNLNIFRDIDAGSVADARVAQMISGAWWLSYIGNASRLADGVFHNDAANAEWGLLNEEARAYPAYYAMWMWNTYAPRTSYRVLASSSRPDVAAFAVNAPVVAKQPLSHNVLLANTRGENTTVQLSIRGFSKLRAVMMHVLDNPDIGVRTGVALPRNAVQTITLKPYSIAVVQFIEPPK
jgi:hypothetical protein